MFDQTSGPGSATSQHRASAQASVHFDCHTPDVSTRVLCDLCNGVIYFQCSRCQIGICFRCHLHHSITCHTKRQSPSHRDRMEEARSQVRRQVKMVEDCLKKLTEDMGKLSLERKAMENRIRLHNATLLGHAGGDAYCACVTSLKHGCDDRAERIDTHMTEAQQALDTVQQQLSGSPPAPLSQAQQRAALFVQGDLQTILNRTSSTTTSLLRHEVKDNTPLLADCLESFMGKVVVRSQDPDTVQIRDAATISDLQSDQEEVSPKETPTSPALVLDTAAWNELCRQVNDLASQVSSFQTANTQLTQQVTEPNSSNSAVSSEESKVQRDTTTGKEKNSNLTTGMAAKNKGAFSEQTVKPAQGSSSQDKSQNNKAQSKISKRLLRRAGKKEGKDRPPSNVQTGHAQNHHAQHMSNVRTSTTGTRQGVEQEAPPNGTVLPEGGPLTASMLADVPPQEQKQMLGECLYYQIQRMYPDLAGKITGMLVELDIPELLEILESQECVRSKAEEAVAVLERYEAELAAAAAAAAADKEK